MEFAAAVRVLSPVSMSPDARRPPPSLPYATTRSRSDDTVAVRSPGVKSHRDPHARGPNRRRSLTAAWNNATENTTRAHLCCETVGGGDITAAGPAPSTCMRRARRPCGGSRMSVGPAARMEGGMVGDGARVSHRRKSGWRAGRCGRSGMMVARAARELSARWQFRRHTYSSTVVGQHHTHQAIHVAGGVTVLVQRMFQWKAGDFGINDGIMWKAACGV